MLEELKEDEIYLTTRRICSTVKKSLDIHRIADEAKVLHLSRTSTQIYKLKLEPTSLAEAALKDVSVRSRLSELKASAYRQKIVLEKATEKCQAHVSVVYQAEIKLLTSNASDRKHLFNKILAPIVELISDLDGLLEILEIHLKDIDQASFALRNATEMLKVLMERAPQRV